MPLLPHFSRICSRAILCLLQTDDTVIMERMLRTLASFCSGEKLVINYQVTKVIIFAQNYKIHKWQINENSAKQVHAYNYLGGLFQVPLYWREHVVSI